jgi:ABC-type phosphate transport system auxiliary subunit
MRRYSPAHVPLPRVDHLAVLAGFLVLLGAGCGGGDGGGGGNGGDIQQEAAEVGALLDRIENLPETATTEQAFTQQLEQIRNQVQTAIEDVADADAPEEVEQDRDQLANRLRSLRTQLTRLQSIAESGDLEAAAAAIERLLSVAEIRTTIERIEAGAG